MIDHLSFTVISAVADSKTSMVWVKAKSTPDEHDDTIYTFHFPAIVALALRIYEGAVIKLAVTRA